MRPWNPQIGIVQDNDVVGNPWRVQLTPGVIIAGGRSGRNDDVDRFCAELQRAINMAHQLNLDGDAT